MWQRKLNSSWHLTWVSIVQSKLYKHIFDLSLPQAKVDPSIEFLYVTFANTYKCHWNFNNQEWFSKPKELIFFGVEDQTKLQP